MPIKFEDGNVFSDEAEMNYANGIGYDNYNNLKNYSEETSQQDTQQAEKDSAEQVDYMTHLFDKLSQTWPAKAVGGFVDALKLPGDVYSGQLDPESEEGIKRSANFATMFGIGGMESAGKELATDVAAKTTKDVLTSPLDLERASDFTAAIRSGLGV